MTPERWREIEELYYAARERQAADRSAFLLEACKGDGQLRREIESLLAQDPTGKNILSHPAANLLPDLTITRAGVIEQVGLYRIEGLLGQGGMGVVYRGFDTKLNRPVAVKFLSDELADTAARRRFQREARTASSLNHPHIITVYDAGEIEGQQYLVTEFVDGGTLKDWARAEKRTWREIVDLLTGIADALSCAHQVGILHRDIKPANILVGRNGYAKLADFGLAKLFEGAEDDVTRTLTEKRTGVGTVIGTIAYMSPEQASGKSVDQRSDIFSFGVVVFEMLAGRRPFAGSTDLEVLQRIIHGKPDSLPADLPPALRLIVEKALEKDPADRYQSMRDLVIDLRRLAHSEQMPAVALPQPRLKRWRLAAVIGVLLVVLAGAGLAVWRSTVRPVHLEYTQLTNFSDSAVAPSLSPDGRMLAFIRGENTFTGPGQVYIKLLPDGEPVQLTHDDTFKMGPLVFSPDGSRVAYSVETRESWVVPVLGGEPSHLLANAGALSWTEAGAVSSRVMFSSLTGQGIHMGVFTSTLSRSDERKVYLPVDVNGMAHRSFLSPDHRSVLIVEMDLTGWLPCRMVPFDGSSAGSRVGPAPAQCTDAAWSPDGKWMYFSANVGNGFHIWRQRFPDGAPEQITSGATEEQGLAFAADGRSFVTSIGETQSTLWVHDSGGERQVTSEGFAYLPSFSSDGKRLFYLQRSRANRRFVSGELWVEDLTTGRHQRLLPDFLMEQYNVSRDGTRVLFITADGTGHAPVWIAPLDGSLPPHRLSSFDSVRALFAPNGEVFFVGGETRTMFLYRVQPDGSGLKKVFEAPASFIYDVSPDSKWVAAWVGSAVNVYPVDGGPPTVLCATCGTAGEENRGVTPPLVSWSRDGKSFYLHSTKTRSTYVLPLRPGQLLPVVPLSGYQLGNMVGGEFPGARPIPEQRAFMGPDSSTYAFPKVVTHRNIYRIGVP